MDAALFTKMLSDKNVLDLRKLGYKYPQADIEEFTELLKNGFYRSLPLKDFSGQNIVYLSSIAQVRLSAAKVLLTPQNSTQLYGVKAMEEEIVSTFTIEQVDFTRDSVRKILSGLAPTDESESRIFGMKKGLEFISDPTNQISEETIYQLYEMAIGAYLSEETGCCPDISTGMTACMWSAQRWSTRAFPGRHCRSAWESWSRLSARILRSTTC